MIIFRKKTKPIHLGSIGIGGDHAISIQSMTTTSTHDIAGTIKQIESLAEAGTQIVRLAVLNERDAEALPTIIKNSKLPLVADIHYRADLAITAIKAGIAGLRLNPGNLTSPEKVKQVVEVAQDYQPVIRIGVNGGSLDKARYPEATPENIVASAFDHIHILEDLYYTNLKVSLKSSDVMTTVEAYRLFSQKSDYPLHLGLTEAGDTFSSSIRSSMALGTLLMEGIGDTIRISVSGDPHIEPKIAKEMLMSLGLSQGLHIIACPTCGRKNIDVEKIVGLLREQAPKEIKHNISVAVMGCIVNGLGEADHADIGIVGIHGATEIYRKGSLHTKLPSFAKEKDMVEIVLHIIQELENTSEVSF